MRELFTTPSATDPNKKGGLLLLFLVSLLALHGGQNRIENSWQVAA
jgi:hypothetical protein